MRGEDRLHLGDCGEAPALTFDILADLILIDWFVCIIHHHHQSISNVP